MGTEHIDMVVNALKKVPAKRLRLVELANQVPIINGVIDPRVLSDLQGDIQLATTEAKVYGAHTMQAVETLASVRPAREE